MIKWFHIQTNPGDFEIMLLNILLVIQALTAVILIGLVLIHSPKGDGIGGIGGAAQLFTSQKGAEAGLNKLTSWVIAFFFAICITTGLYGHFLIGK